MTTQPIQNAPPQHSRFFGRSHDRATIRDCLHNPDCRLLTLVGAGGIGKTRLALTAAADFAAEQTSAVTFVPLQPINDVADMPDAIANALGFKLTSQSPAQTQLVKLLGGHSRLLILDNFEHLTEGVQLLSELLHAVPALGVLATSREPLQLQEEWVYPVNGLEIEGDGAAFAVFVSAARRVRPNFDPTPEQETINKICHIVAGSPLAIELAAAWTGTLGCAAILAELQTSHDLLATRLRNVPARHRSIRAVFDQTWSRLTQSERTVFAKLSVLRGSFHRADAEAIAQASLVQIARLQELSLVQRSAENRWQLHELTRQYAASQLSEAAQTAQEIAHASYYLTFAQTQYERSLYGQQADAIMQINPALDNIRAAWRRAIQHQQFELLAASLLAICAFHRWQGRYLEVVRYADDLLAHAAQLPSAQADQTRITCWLLKAWSLTRFGQLDEATALAQQAVERYTANKWDNFAGFDSDPTTIFALVATIRGDHDEAIRLSDSSITHATAAQNDFNLASAQHNRLFALARLWRLDEANEAGLAALAAAERLGNTWLTIYIQNDLSELALHRQQPAVARRYAEASYQLVRQLDSPDTLALTEILLAESSVAAGELAQAQTLFTNALSHFERQEDAGAIGRITYGLARIAIQQREAKAARRHLVTALANAAELQFLGLLNELLPLSAEWFTQAGQPERASDVLTQKEAIGESIDALVALARDVQVQMAQVIVRETTDIPTVVTSSPLVEPLTAREQEVLELLAIGSTNQQIADKLILSKGTVKYYTSQIYGKLGVNNRTAAVIHAQEIGLLNS